MPDRSTASWAVAVRGRPKPFSSPPCKSFCCFLLVFFFFSFFPEAHKQPSRRRIVGCYFDLPLTKGLLETRAA